MAPLAQTRRARWSGARAHHFGTDVLVRRTHESRRALPTLGTIPVMLPQFPIAILAAVSLLLAACSAAPPASFDPTGPCTSDGSAPGAYPDLEVLLPATFRGEKPGTLDSGRHCTGPSLGSLASAGISEIRFAGATWSFGAERAAVLAVFEASGLTADSLADFYANGARTASRTQILAESSPTIVGRGGRRLDTQTGERLQTVVVWPSAVADRVNVVITNDLPDARIQEAIDAFGQG